MMRYKQFRLAKRDGEIVQQYRYIETETKSVTPWWKVWENNYDLETEYGPWVDIPIEEIGDE